MRIARGKAAVGRDLVQVLGIDDFENGLVEIEAVVAQRIAFDLLLQGAQVGGKSGVVEFPFFTLPLAA